MKLSEIVTSLRSLEPDLRLRAGIGIAVILLFAAALSIANGEINRLSKKRAAREADVAEMLVLKQRYKEASASSQKITNRLAAVRPDDSPAKVIEEIGIKGKNFQVRPLKGEEQGGLIEDAAEIKIDGVTGNEMVNLLYKLEKGVKPVVIKRAVVKTRFDDPSRLDLNLSVALLKTAPAGGR